MSFGFLQVFYVELENPHKISNWNLWITGVDCSNSINYDRVKVMSYSILCYSYLLLGLNLQPSDDFSQKHLPMILGVEDKAFGLKVLLSEIIWWLQV